MPELPQRIGAYRVLRLLGEGGMGSVFVAEQDNPRRLVALKVLRAQLASREIVRRFALEAHVLARLQHPYIAQIYEAGAFDTARGPQPFLAMELVDGVRLDEFLVRESPTTAERVELLSKLCDAVEHAHQRGVIHRDLKPGNILVDARREPKVLDFGIARASDADVQLATSLTEVGQILGTLAYMSPEQVSGDPTEIDARADVYALGVIAHQTLSGELPHDLLGLPVWEAVRVIRSVEPTRLSATRRELRGDLETIVAKALEKEKTRRYGSARELGDDLLRFARHEPITAHPPSVLYQLRKFSTRHRVLMVSLIAVFCALATGTIVSSSQYFVAQRARDFALGKQGEAERAAERARAVNDFLLQRMLKAASPMVDGASVRVVDVLARAAAEVERSFAGDPEVELEVRATLGACFIELRRFAEAEEQIDASLALATRLHGENDARTLRLRHRLGQVYVGTERRAEALSFHGETIARMRAVLGPEHVDTLEALAEMASLLDHTGDWAGSNELRRTVLAARERTLGLTARETIQARLSLANQLSRAGVGAAEAQETATRALADALSALGEDDPVTINARGLTAHLAGTRFEFATAQRELELALAAARRVYGERHPDTAVIESELGTVFDALGDHARAALHYRNAHAALVEALGPDHGFALVATSNLSGAAMRMGELDEAEALQLAVLDARRRVLGEHPDVAESLDMLGQIELRRGAPDSAARWFAEALALRERTTGDNSEHLASTLSRMVDAQIARKDPAATEHFMRRALAVDLALYGEADSFSMSDRRRLTQHLLTTGRPAEAEATLCPAIEALDVVYPDNARVRARFARLYATCFADQELFEEAERWLQFSLAASALPPKPDAEESAVTRAALAELYEQWGRPADAASVRANAPATIEAAAPRAR